MQNLLTFDSAKIKNIYLGRKNRKKFVYFGAILNFFASFSLVGYLSPTSKKSVFFLWVSIKGQRKSRNGSYHFEQDQIHDLMRLDKNDMINAI